MAQIDQRIAKAEEALKTAQDKLKQARALKQKQEALKRATLAKAERAAETRRKVLVGAFILEQLERNGTGAALLTYEGGRFADWLTRPHDRELFGLTGQPQPVPHAAVHAPIRADSRQPETLAGQGFAGENTPKSGR